MSKQAIDQALGDVMMCATCPREAAGERIESFDDPSGGKRIVKIHLCRYCNRAFSLGAGDSGLLSKQESAYNQSSENRNQPGVIDNE